MIADHLRTWDREHRDGPGPRIAVHPAGTPDGQIPELPGGRVIDKIHCRVTLSWPLSATAAEERWPRTWWGPLPLFLEPVLSVLTRGNGLEG
ncbi:hypothetical protein WEB32_04765 [Streptomyces netropsis]|uniref:Uncharacterized protein n=1 Tax=Streptomyces netropsis TaxID=55404 RepID=A0A7W7LG42_STRNE|nr:hypothetical protein [Streptomyces netropsis]MBB4889033.1 hypothetical protein [Streptomyces netropsis]GGR10875.1 hypothetical protein GCM10010219_14530 [Streptomyces netropsis]